jgi:sugar phosphate isomerase/epimerase
MAAISGTFNLCDPNAERLQDNLHRLGFLAAACRWLDTRIITLCTGTLDSDEMWRWHPENVRRSTWDILIHSMRKAVEIADRYEVTLAFEPEIHNVVNSVSKARKLLDEVDSPWLKVVIDPANLMRAGDFPRLKEILDESFDWLGRDIVLAHAKNPYTDEKLSEDEVRSALETDQDLGMLFKRFRMILAALDRTDENREEVVRHFVLQAFYHTYFKSLGRMSYAGAITMHGLEEKDVDPMISFLREILKYCQ